MMLGLLTSCHALPSDVAVDLFPSQLQLPKDSCTDRRPPPEGRAFVSPAVESSLQKLSRQMSLDPELACLFRNTLPNTLDTTVRRGALGTGTTFIITGDINAMWLRDSTNQVVPYLRFAKADPKLAAMLSGVVRQQTLQILADPYANAHYLTSSPVKSPNSDDDTSSPSPTCKASNGNTSYMGSRVNGMRPGIFERKFELDSLLAFLKLSRSLHEALIDEHGSPHAEALHGGSPADDASSGGRRGAAGPDWRSPLSHVLDQSLPYDASWIKAVRLVLDTLDDQSMSSASDAAAPCGPAYFFQRSNLAGQGPLDTLLKGVGTPTAYTGMVRSAFRPSDDACTYGFHIPANAMAVVELRRIAALLRKLGRMSNIPRAVKDEAERFDEARDDGFVAHADELARRCDSTAARISAGIARYGVIRRPELGGDVYAYEVDGFGNAILMDDANVPSLLSLPYLGFVEETDPTYMRTRAYVLSNASNPWYFVGSAGEGIGGPHVGAGAIWPMSIIMRALTSRNDSEISTAISTLKASAAVPNSWLMHESFSASDASRYTRPWFAWANSLFGELIIKVSAERPHLVGIPRTRGRGGIEDRDEGHK